MKFFRFLVVASFVATLLSLASAEAASPIPCGDDREFKIENAGASVPNGSPNGTLACQAAVIALKTALIAGGPGCADCKIPEACFPSVSFNNDNNVVTTPFFDPITNSFGCTARYTGKYKIACSKCE